MRMWLVKDLLFIGALLIMAALTVVGVIGSALDIDYLRENGWLGFSLGEWFFFTLGVSFWFVVIRLLVLLRNLRVLRPSIAVSLFPEGTYRRLRVLNNGGTGNFRADAKIVEPETSHVSPWWVKWRSTYSRTQEIYSGESQILDICSVGRTSGTPIQPVVRFHTARQEIEPDIGVDHRYVDRFDLDREGNTVIVEIEIRSEPRLLKSFCVRYSIVLLEQGLIRMVELTG